MSFNPNILPDSLQAPTLSLPPAFGSLDGRMVDSVLLRLAPNASPLPPWWSRARDAYMREYLRTSVLLSGIVYGRAQELANTGSCYSQRFL